MLLVLLIAMAGAPSASSIDAPRRAFVQCIHKYEADSMARKVPPDEYKAAVSSACPAQAAALRAALVAFDVGMGTKRAAAAANADIDVGDYFLSSEERYRANTAPQ